MGSISAPTIARFFVVGESAFFTFPPRHSTPFAQSAGSRYNRPYWVRVSYPHRTAFQEVRAKG
ncbi:MAG TPA: hypothetical protein PLJ27_17000, partial [Polyangiaceae bacterium]|nr:hypothetical protein [Polyangiaceae bacterium]